MRVHQGVQEAQEPVAAVIRAAVIGAAAEADDDEGKQVEVLPPHAAGAEVPGVLEAVKGNGVALLYGDAVPAYPDAAAFLKGAVAGGAGGEGELGRKAPGKVVDAPLFNGVAGAVVFLRLKVDVEVHKDARGGKERVFSTECQVKERGLLAELDKLGAVGTQARVCAPGRDLGGFGKGILFNEIHDFARREAAVLRNGLLQDDGQDLGAVEDGLALGVKPPGVSRGLQGAERLHASVRSGHSCVLSVFCVWIFYIL